MNLEQMGMRARAHTALREELTRQGALHRHEQELLLDTADALLFDEPEALARRGEALCLMRHLEAAGRRTRGESERLQAALEACGAVPAPVAA